MLSPVKKTIAVSVGGVFAAVGSALCCVGPLVAVALGVSGAGLAATFDPLQPYFIAATGLFLGAGFWLLRREEAKACSPGTACASPGIRRRMKAMLWVATAVAIPLMTFEWWSQFIIG